MEGWGYSAEERRLQIRSWVVSNQRLGKSEPNVPENLGNKSWKFVLDWFRFKMFQDMAVCQNLVPLVNIKIAGQWMFIPLKMVLIGIDPYPYWMVINGFKMIPSGGHNCCHRKTAWVVHLPEGGSIDHTDNASQEKSLHQCITISSPVLPCRIQGQNNSKHVKTGALKHSHRLVPSPKNNVSLSWLLLKTKKSSMAQ